jgi:hypothetical protein
LCRVWLGRIPGWCGVGWCRYRFIPLPPVEDAVGILAVYATKLDAKGKGGCGVRLCRRRKEPGACGVV